MIEPGITEFPNNVLALLELRIPTFCDPDSDPDDRIKVFQRQLRPSDPRQCVGIFPLTKRADTSSYEQRTSQEPTIKRYNLVLQTFVQDTDQEACISVHSILSNRLWRMWFHDLPLDTGLKMLSVTADNVTERFQQRGVEHQRYLSNEIQGTFSTTSWIECWVETETVET